VPRFDICPRDSLARRAQTSLSVGHESRRRGG
jgi:hypothetical protein